MDNSTGAKPKLKERRKISVPVVSTDHKDSLEALKQKLKRKMSLPDKNVFNVVFDPMAKAHDSFRKRRGITGVSYGEKMYDHFCLWDPDYPENPNRLKAVIKRCNELGLIERCQQLPAREATKEELEFVHSENVVNLMESLQSATEDKLKEVSAKNDSIYINNDTYTAARMATGCTLEATKAVVEGSVHNAMALVRPPGHHAMKDDYCGYSFFNNVAIAAKFAVETLNVKKVLIVDWDIHHGQGTQQTFYKDKRVLYFSMHRYEHGNFWPNLRESEFDYAGEGGGKGYNINIPVNETGMHNEDYLHIFHNLLLPVAYEFSPDLILISAGYDACLGCPEGMMKLTPAFYAHMTHSLMSLAEGKVVAILEGGYFIETLAESAALTLRALLGDPCPRLVDHLSSPSISIKETILNVMAIHREHWKCLQFISPEVKGECHPLDPHPSLDYPLKNEDSKFEIMSCYPVTPKEESDLFLQELERLQADTSLSVPEHRLCMVYDKAMEKHRNEAEPGHPERPSRTQDIMKKLQEAEILKRVHLLQPRQATLREVQQVHTLDWVNTLQHLKDFSPGKRKHLAHKYNSVFFNDFSADAALYAAGCLLQVVDSVCGGESRSGIAVIRPPGHHAESQEPNGFCLINNVAVGATYAIKKHDLKRILILDWDIHHGNGIQNIFESNPKVLYVSMHAYCDADFFPCSCKANSCFVGKKSGRGYNVNIPWSKTGMKDGDYLAAFFRVVLPICNQFDPELVFVSAGFDAAINDPLGKCHITPECFAHMTHFLMTLASGKLVLALEGGYNLVSTSYSMTMCAKALLGDPLPTLEETVAGVSALKTINEVIEIQRELWELLFDQDQLWLQIQADGTPKTPEFSTPPELTPFSTPQKESKSVLDLASDFMNLSITMDLNKTPPETDEPCSSGSADQTTEEPLEVAMGVSPNSTVLLIQQMMEAQGMHAVVPLAWCPHLDTVAPVPPEGLDATAACKTCSDCSENWVCLVCYEVHCSRFSNGHMLRHRESSDHQVALSFSDLSVWCYVCESYLDNAILKGTLAAASSSKFGV